MEPLFVLYCATLAKRSVASAIRHQAFFTSM